jgi:hypothetical protein
MLPLSSLRLLIHGVHRLIVKRCGEDVLFLVRAQVDNREARTVLKELGQAAMCLFEIKSHLILSGLCTLTHSFYWRGKNFVLKDHITCKKLRESCVRVCVCACVRVCVMAHERVGTCVRLRACMSPRMHAPISVYMRV